MTDSEKIAALIDALQNSNAALENVLLHHGAVMHAGDRASRARVAAEGRYLLDVLMPPEDDEEADPVKDTDPSSTRDTWARF